MTSPAKDAFTLGQRTWARAPSTVGILLLASGLAIGFVGCASPGIPRPPSLHLPATVTDLTATRIGDRVELHWTAPARTTDGLDLTIPTVVEICRDPVAAATQCTAVLSVAGHDGPSSVTDLLPPSLLASAIPRPLLAYRVRVLNRGGRSSPPSLPALIPAGPGLSSVEAFRAIPQRAGVLLEWRNVAPRSDSREEASTIEVIRIAQAAARKNGGKNAVSTRERKPAEVRLRTGRTDAAFAPARDLGGMFDREALQNETYTYQAQRILAFPVAGKTIELRGEPTPPLAIAMRDTFPPEPPHGLVSIPGSVASSAEHAPPHPTIDLSWAPNAESDVTGYHVYRVDLGTGSIGGAVTPRRLTETPVPGPAYRDAAVLADHRYEYQVTAVDRSGNESERSTAVRDSTEGH